MKLKSILLLTFLLTMFCVSAQAYNNDTTQKQYIVKYNKNCAEIFDNAYIPQLGADVVDEEELQMYIKAGVVELYEEDAVAELFDIDGEYIIPEKKYSSQQWHHDTIQTDIAFNLGFCGEGLKIGVIDSGVNPHQDLDENILTGKNYTSDIADDTSDEYGHGTFVSGLIAAADNDIGIIGVAPKSKIVPLKCFTAKTGKVSDIIKALYDAVDVFDCDIINMSFGLSSNSSLLSVAVQYAADNGVICVAASGNNGSTALAYPAAYDNVIGVGAVTSTGTHSSFSQHNTSVMLTAPGSSVYSTTYSGTNTYGTNNGTSFSAPIVTGPVAIMKSIKPDITYEEITELIQRTSIDKGDEGYDEYYGWGILNIENIVTDMLSDYPCYIKKSPDDNSLYLYNNSDTLYDGIFIGKEYKDENTENIIIENIQLEPKKIFRTSSESFKKCFLWNSMENIIPSSMVYNKTEYTDNIISE